MVNVLSSLFQTKLRRMIRYLRLKDLKSKTVKPVSPEDEDVIEAVGTCFLDYYFYNLIDM